MNPTKLLAFALALFTPIPLAGSAVLFLTHPVAGVACFLFALLLLRVAYDWWNAG
jgi:hypothetical protein